MRKESEIAATNDADEPRALSPFEERGRAAKRRAAAVAASLLGLGGRGTLPQGLLHFAEDRGGRADGETVRDGEQVAVADPGALPVDLHESMMQFCVFY